MQEITEWMNRPDIRDLRKLTVKDLYATDFNRDPNRPLLYNPMQFKSPADGFIIYSKIVDPGMTILSIKGGRYTVNNLLRLEMKVPCLVVGIFMTLYDVHVNRMPTSGFLDYWPLEALKAENQTMSPLEMDILTTLTTPNKDLKYNLYNERKINRVYSNDLQQPYYMVQMADFEVDVIAQYYKPKSFIEQGKRFAVIKNGSQVDLIIPFINPKIDFINLVDKSLGKHIEAGLDVVVQVEVT